MHSYLAIFIAIGIQEFIMCVDLVYWLVYNILMPIYMSLVRKWASQRSLHVQLKDVKPAPELLKDMYSLFNNVRMLAVTSVAVLAEDQATTRRTHRKPHKRSHWSGQDKTLRENKVTEELVHGLEGLLEDSVVRVRVPSAITLSAINRHVSKV